MKKFEGSINQINIQNNQTLILGWLWDREHPNERSRGALALDDQVLESFECSQYREDLEKNGIGDGKHAYEIVLDFPFDINVVEQIKLHPQGKKNKLYEAIDHEPANIIDNRINDDEAVLEEVESHQPNDFSQEIDQKLEAIYSEGGGKDEALDYLEKLKSENPVNYSIYHKIGDFYYNLKQFDDAIKNHNLAIQYNDNALWSYHNLSVIYAELNEWEKSLKQIEKIESIAPEFFNENRNSFLVNFHTANRLAHENKLSVALKYYRDAYLLNPNSEECLYCLIDNCHKQDNFFELFYLLDAKLPDNPDLIDQAVELWLEKNTLKNNKKDSIELCNNLLYLSPGCLALHEQINKLNGLSNDENDDKELELNETVRSYRNKLEAIGQFLDAFKKTPKTI